MMMWVDAVMWWLTGTLGYVLELAGVVGLFFITGAWALTRIREMFERDS